MLYEKLLSDFYEKLKEIQIKSPDLLTETNFATILCSRTISGMRNALEDIGFENIDQEIYFFKKVKVIPMQYLIYYTEVRSCEIRMPKIGSLHQMGFLEKQVDKVNSFFATNTEFLIYLDQGYEHFDKHYFMRKHLNNTPVIKSYPYYKDPIFDTSHDGILARIRGLGLFTSYLKEKKKELKKKTITHSADKEKSKINWTGSYVGFVELVYGCGAMGYFNDGNIDIIKVIEILGDFLNIERGNSTRTYNELKNRKSSRIKFFEETGQKLLDKMDREDGLKVG